MPANSNPQQPETPTFLSRFSRLQSGGRFIPIIDGLRFLAIISVIIFHWACFVRDKALLKGVTLALGPFDNGRLGVQLFFVISGFILVLPFARAYLEQTARPKLRDYFLRRLTRLEPPYLLNLLILFIVLSIKDGGAAAKFWHLLASCIYSHNIIYGIPSTINFVAWTLEIEVQLYLLATLLAYVFSLKNIVVRRSLLLLAILAIPLALRLTGLTADLNVAGYIQYFLAGFLLADCYLTSWRDNPPHKRWCDAVLLCIGLIILLVDWHESLILLALPFLVFAVCACAFCGVWPAKFLSNRWIATIGGMCYTIYLYHELLIWILGPTLLRLHIPGANFYGTVALKSLFLVPAILLVCAGLFVFFERPFMQRDWYRRFLKSNKDN